MMEYTNVNKLMVKYHGKYDWESIEEAKIKVHDSTLEFISGKLFDNFLFKLVYIFINLK